jgi:hypothetical protein
MQEAISGATGSSWTMLAAIDRLVELGELREISTTGAVTHQIFVSARN